MRTKKSLGLPHVVPLNGTKWGQNFLRDKKILKKIADFAQIGPEDVVVEVGPGEGALTEFLLERAKKVIAVEKDKNLVEMLKEKFRKEILDDRLQIIEGDILDLEPEKSSVNEPCERDWREHEEFSSRKISVRVNRSFFPANKYVLVGNIPYYITGTIFKKFLQSENPPKSITFVVQKEVGERIMARDGKESILSISIKVYGTPEFGGVIKAGSFYPRPKVDSAIISIRSISKKMFDIRQKDISQKVLGSPRSRPVSHGTGLRSAKLFSKHPFAGKAFEQKFFEILKKGFSHKRKLLIRNLGVKKEIFEKCGISERVRAENLSVDNWICLAKELV